MIAESHLVRMNHSRLERSRRCSSSSSYLSSHCLWSCQHEHAVALPSLEVKVEKVELYRIQLAVAGGAIAQVITAAAAEATRFRCLLSMAEDCPRVTVMVCRTIRRYKMTQLIL